MTCYSLPNLQPRIGHRDNNAQPALASLIVSERVMARRHCLLALRFHLDRELEMVGRAEPRGLAAVTAWRHSTNVRNIDREEFHG